MEIKDIKKFIELIEDTDITELSWEKDGVKIGFKKGVTPDITGLKTKKSVLQSEEKELFSPSAVGGKKETGGETNQMPPEEGLVTIKAPIVGTFYRTSGPDTPFYVEEGSIIEKGQRLCVIEAMKVMKEISAEVSGKITKIFVNNGDHIEYGQSLFLVDTKIKKS